MGVEMQEAAEISKFKSIKSFFSPWARPVTRREKAVRERREAAQTLLQTEVQGESTLLLPKLSEQHMNVYDAFLKTSAEELSQVLGGCSISQSEEQAQALILLNSICSLLQVISEVRPIPRLGFKQPRWKRSAWGTRMKGGIENALEQSWYA